MGFLDEVRSYFRDDDPPLAEQAEELDPQRREDQFGDLPNEIEEMSPEDVANTFARMEQQTRLSFVRNNNISEEKWREMRSSIENNTKQQNFWGIDSKQTIFKQGVEVCACHEEGLQAQTETRGVQKTIGQMEGSSKASKTEVGGKVGGSGGVGVPGVGTVDTTSEVSGKKGRARGETQQEMAQSTDSMSRTQTFYSCRVEPTDATVSRRAFLRIGQFHIRKTYDKTESDNSLIDGWGMDADVERTQQQEAPEKGIETLREERDGFQEQIEELDEELEMYGDRIEQNKEFISQCEAAIADSEGDIDTDDLDKRDRLLEKHEELQAKKKDLKAEKTGVRTQKTELQDRIEEHETTEEESETTTQTESADQPAVESEETTEVQNEKASDTSGTDGDPPTSDGTDDQREEKETVTKDTTDEQKTNPKQASADASTNSTDSTDETDEAEEAEETEGIETNETDEYENKGERYLDRYTPSGGSSGGFKKSK